MAALFVRILIPLMHSGKFLERGDVVPADSVLLDLAIGRTQHFLGNVCEVVEVPKAAAEPAPETEAPADVHGVEAEAFDPLSFDPVAAQTPKRGRPAKAAAEPAPVAPALADLAADTAAEPAPETEA